jgi:hypothetical protein
MKLSRLGVFALMACLAACAPRFDTVKQAAVSPVRRDDAIVVRPPIVGEILVDGKPERELTSTFTPEERARWVTLLNVSRAATLDGLFESRGNLRLAKDGHGPAIEVLLTSVDLARQDPRGTPKLKLGATLRVFAKDGQLADEVRLHSVVEAEVVSEDMIEVTRERRFKRGGTDLGRQIADYLKARAGLE